MRDITNIDQLDRMPRLLDVLAVQCRVLQVSAAGYHAHLVRPPFGFLVFEDDTLPALMAESSGNLLLFVTYRPEQTSLLPTQLCQFPTDCLY